MGKIITLPISCTMNTRHSKKLEWAIGDFITSNDGTYYDDEIESGIISCYFRLQNGICIEQKVHIRKYDYVCHTTLSYSINPKDKENMSRYVQMTNAINSEFDYGHFEVNFRTGDILFKSYYEPDDKVCSRGLFKLLVHPRRMINKFGHCFLMLTENGNKL